MYIEGALMSKSRNIALSLLNSVMIPTPFSPEFGVDQIRFVGGGGNEGEVEVFFDNEWGGICHDHWGINEGQVRIDKNRRNKQTKPS